jgi:hypothetical protein
MTSTAVSSVETSFQDADVTRFWEHYGQKGSAALKAMWVRD